MTEGSLWRSITISTVTSDRGRRIDVLDYDPSWPELFARQAERLRSAFPHLPCSVEHVGSTAVPDLAAKPVVDIHLAVPNSADEAAYFGQLEALGYCFAHRSPDWFEHRLFKGWAPETNLHIFSLGCPELDRCKLFRDWLRHDSVDRELYAATKRALASKDWAHVQDYANAKTAVVAQIMERAELWRRAGGFAAVSS